MPRRSARTAPKSQPVKPTVLGARNEPKKLMKQETSLNSEKETHSLISRRGPATPSTRIKATPLRAPEKKEPSDILHQGPEAPPIPSEEDKLLLGNLTGNLLPLGVLVVIFGANIPEAYPAFFAECRKLFNSPEDLPDLEATSEELQEEENSINTDFPDHPSVRVLLTNLHSLGMKIGRASCRERV